MLKDVVQAKALNVPMGSALFSCSFMICHDKFMSWAAAGPMEQIHALRGAWSQPAPGEPSLDQPNHSQPADPHVWKKKIVAVAVGLWDDEGFVTQRYCCSN